MSNDKGGGGFVAGLVIGAIVGGAAALLLAQEDMRDLIVGKAREAGNFAMDATDDLRGKVGDTTAQWTTSASDLYARGKDIVDGARANFNDAVGDAKNAAAKTRDDLQNRADG